MHNSVCENRIEELKRRVEEQRAALSSLASSFDGEDRLGDLVKRVEKPCEALNGLAADSFSFESFF